MSTSLYLSSLGALLCPGAVRADRSISSCCLPPTNYATMFSLITSAQHAVCQGFATGKREGWSPACAHYPEWRLELWVISAVLHSSPFGSGYGGLWGTKKLRFIPDYLSERGQGKWVYGGPKMGLSSFFDTFICSLWSNLDKFWTS